MKKAAKLSLEDHGYVDECGIKEHIKREYRRTAASVKTEKLNMERHAVYPHSPDKCYKSFLVT